MSRVFFVHLLIGECYLFQTELLCTVEKSKDFKHPQFSVKYHVKIWRHLEVKEVSCHKMETFLITKIKHRNLSSLRFFPRVIINYNFSQLALFLVNIC